VQIALVRNSRVCVELYCLVPSSGDESAGITFRTGSAVESAIDGTEESVGGIGSMNIMLNTGSFNEIDRVADSDSDCGWLEAEFIVRSYLNRPGLCGNATDKQESDE